MLDVWTADDDAYAGRLERSGRRGSVFVPSPDAPPAARVSLTSDGAVATSRHGPLPVFDMNVPEGALRDAISARIGIRSPAPDGLDLLSFVGGSQIGRLRCAPEGSLPDEDAPFMSVAEILSTDDATGALRRHLTETFLPHSGLSGVQPKVMVRGSEGRGPATHVVKFWDAEYPQLAANEYFCFRLAAEMGLEVPQVGLSDDGRMLVVRRFDVRPDGTSMGFEDLCVLNGRVSGEKYRGSLETAVFGTLRSYGDPEHADKDRADLFAMVVLSHVVRNGDAHLKNFGVLYDDPTRPARLAPVYDVVSTAAYIPGDDMALTLEGRRTWPGRDALVRLGTTRAGLADAEVDLVFERTSDAASSVLGEISARMRDDPGFAAVGSRMLDVWSEGIRELADHPSPVAAF